MSNLSQPAAGNTVLDNRTIFFKCRIFGKYRYGNTYCFCDGFPGVYFRLAGYLLLLLLGN
jgi:hypothetical protein